jgi:hypothetical protein
VTTPAGWSAVAQRWDEHEPGWGFRPDGWSLHVDAAQHAAFLDAHRRAPSGVEHDHPDGDPYAVVVREPLHGRLLASRYGLRTFARGTVPEAGWVIDDVPEAQDAASYLRRLEALARGGD